MTDSANEPEQRAADPPAPTDLTELGKFTVVRRLGSGGMGVVYLAIDTANDRQVALKVLSPENTLNPTMVKRFKAEALAASNLKHEGIVGIFEAGSVGNRLYIALEYVEGTDVGQLVQTRGRLPVRRSLDITRQVARALGHANRQGIVHRDIKPSNLLIRQDGAVKLADMGLARSIDDTGQASITRAGTTVGTVDYIAPEQARSSKAADARSDIYALGCTWYHMLTGEPPFPEGSITRKLRHHANTPVPDPRLVNEEISEEVVVVLAKMLAKAPERRYQTPEELLEALDEIDLKRKSLSPDALVGLAEEDPSQPPARTTRAPNRDDAGSSLDVPSTGRTPTPPVRRSGRPRRPDDPPPSRQSGAPAAIPDRPRRDRSGSAADVDATTGRSQADEQLAPDRSRRSHPPAPEHDVSSGPAETRGKRRGSSYRIPGSKETSPSRSPSPAEGELDDGLTDKPVLKRSRGTSFSENTGQAGFDLARLKPAAIVLGAVLGVLVLALLIKWAGSSLISTGGPGDGNLGDNSAGSPGSGMTNLGPADDVQPPDEPSPDVVSPADPAPDDPPVTVEPPSRTGPAVAIPAVAAVQRQGERALLPDWVGIDGSSPPGDRRPLIEVVRQPGATHQFRYLDEALAAIPQGGAVIRLMFEGPFFLSPVQLQVGGPVAIVAGPDHRPTVALVAGGRADSSVVIDAVDSSITLERLDLVVLPGSFHDDTDLALVSVVGGDLAVHRCTLSLMAPRTGRTTAFVLEGLPTDRSRSHVRVLLERVHLRGPRFGAVEVQQSSTDLVAVNCLFLTGGAPVLSLTHRGSAPAAAPVDPALPVRAPLDKSDPEVARRVVLVSVTAVTSGPMLDFGRGLVGGRPGSTSVTIVNSILAARPAPKNSPVLLAVGQWPVRNFQPEGTGKFLGLAWKSVGSVYCGFRELIRTDPVAGTINVRDVSEWRDCWSSPTEDAWFRQGRWPSSDPPGEHRFGPRAAYASGRLGKAGVTATDGAAPGCRVTAPPLADLDPTGLARATGLQQRSRWPNAVPRRQKTVTVKLSEHQDLGRYLQSKSFPDGTTVVVEGAGRHISSPIRVNGKTLILQFKQVEGAPLVIVARGYPLGEEENPEDYQAFLLVRHGGLEINGGRFEVPNRRKRLVPQWFLLASDSNFALRNCSVSTPLSDASRLKGLIRWERSAGPQSSQTGRIDGCHLVSRGPLLDADFRRHQLLVRDSLLVSLSTLLRLKVIGHAGAVGSVIDIRRSTLSASETVLSVLATANADPDARPLRIFIDETIFAPPVPTGSDPAAPVVLLRCPTSFLQQGLVRWWGRLNGYSSQVTRYLASPDGASGPHTGGLAVWRSRWEPFRRIQALHGPEAVHLAATLPARNRLAIDSFALDANCRASHAGPGGSMLGANIATLNRRLYKPGKGTPTGSSPSGDVTKDPDKDF